MTVTEVAVDAAARRTVEAADPEVATSGTRGRRQSSLTRLGGDIPGRAKLALGAAGLATLFGGWLLVSTTLGSASFLVPTPGATWRAFADMVSSGDLVAAVGPSARRVGLAYAISMSIGVVLGVLVGSFRSAEAFLEPQIGFLRYIPATALGPLFVLWFGIDEAPKLAAVIAGTVFYNVLMIGDVARAVPMELVNASYTLGAGRFTVLRRVILPHSYPGIIDVARINLAAAWLMLVAAELYGAQEGLAYRLVQAQRFRQYDRIFAILIVFGVIGAASDVALRWLRRHTAPWSLGSR